LCYISHLKFVITGNNTKNCKIWIRRISKGCVDETSARDALIDERLKAQNIKNLSSTKDKNSGSKPNHFIRGRIIFCKLIEAFVVRSQRASQKFNLAGWGLSTQH